MFVHLNNLEFRQQLSCLEVLAGRVPHVVLNDLRQNSLTKLQTLLNEAEEEHDKIAEDIDRDMVRKKSFE